MIGGKEKKNMRDGELFKRGVPEKLNLINLKSAKPMPYSEFRETFKIELFAKRINGWKPLFIIAESSILDTWLSSEYACVVW